MKLLYFVVLLAIFTVAGIISRAQETGHLKDLLKSVQPDTIRVKLLIQLAGNYYFVKPDSCLVLAKEAIGLSQKSGFYNGELEALNMAGESLRFLGEFPQALEMQFKALQINQSNHDKNGEAVTLGFIGFTYVELNEFRQGLNYLNEANAIYSTLSDPIRSTFNISNIGNAYERMNILDSALFFQRQARERSINLPHANLKILILTRLGIVLERLDKNEQALQYYHEALQDAYAIGDKVNPSKIQNRIAEIYRSMNKKDSSLYYARLSYVNSISISQKLQTLAASNLLVRLFRNNTPDSVIYYQDIAIAMNDSLYGPQKLKQLQLLMLSQQEQQQKIQQEQQQYKNKTRTVALIAILGFFLIIAIILLRNNRHKQKVNSLLRHQKDEIQKNMVLLKSTQGQLIQREKLASLGELTAGIAHEIQNPLNFVNNFSEVNREIIVEMKEEIDKGNYGEVKIIADDIEANEEKINHHGKRADAIVKSMLEHSRTSTGIKEPTDINKLADEYLRLAYHGFRAKDKNFNAKMETDFDKTIGKINIIQQDIGRVLLNLYNNSFYACAERSRSAVDEQKSQNLNSYEPTVSVTTKKLGNSVIITVSDNGNGIPQIVVDKIFQPFFTTKPTGEGTGLGLSLSYDIVKAHSGEIKVATKEGEGTEFIIQLPIV
jgi:two-component system, NtrC family, sensor kinase